MTLKIVVRSTIPAASFCPFPTSSEKLRTIDAEGHPVTIKKVCLTSVAIGKMSAKANASSGITKSFITEAA